MSDHVAPSGEKASLLSNILAIIGLIILVIIIVWGLVHLAELSSGWVSSLFSTSGPTIKVTAPADATSGAPATVSWDYSSATTGSYAFLYQCQTGLEFAIIDTVKNTASGIPCGAAFNVTPSNSSIQILPLISGTTSKSVPFSILFVPTTGTQVEGTATMTIHPSSATVTTTPTKTTTAKPVTTAKPAGTTYTAPRTLAPADLSVRVVSQYVDQYGNGTVTFNVSNIGGRTSGAYTFSAILPTQTGTPYSSALQSPLSGGSHIANTLHFSQAVSGNFQVTVHAGDVNQSNNYASQWVNAPVTYTSQPYNNYNSYNSYNTGGYSPTDPAYAPQYQTPVYTY